MHSSTPFAEQGFAIVPGALGEAELAAARTPGLPSSGRGGSRCLLVEPWCAHLARRLRAQPALQALIPSAHVAVQCTYFEKSATRNWLVPLHQDLSIPVAGTPVAGQLDSDALRGWSRKDGSWFVQPPAQLLEQLVAVRLHLDACGPADGPLRVVPGTHREGIIAPRRALALRDAFGETECTLTRGDALVLRPLLLHASSKGNGHSRRRVLHFVFGPCELPCGLRWPEAAV